MMTRLTRHIGFGLIVGLLNQFVAPAVGSCNEEQATSCRESAESGDVPSCVSRPYGDFTHTCQSRTVRQFGVGHCCCRTTELVVLCCRYSQDKHRLFRCLQSDDTVLTNDSRRWLQLSYLPWIPVVLGCALFVFIIVVVVVCLRRHRRLKSSRDSCCSSCCCDERHAQQPENGRPDDDVTVTSGTPHRHQSRRFLSCLRRSKCSVNHRRALLSTESSAQPSAPTLDELCDNMNIPLRHLSDVFLPADITCSHCNHSIILAGTPSPHPPPPSYEESRGHTLLYSGSQPTSPCSPNAETPTIDEELPDAEDVRADLNV